MNYIAEVNSFYNWITFNQIPADAQALWHLLMQMNNRCAVKVNESWYWRVSFSVPNSALISVLAFSRQQLDRMRNVLIQTGRIVYKKGKGSQSGIYTMLPFDASYSAGYIEGCDEQIWIFAAASKSIDLANARPCEASPQGKPTLGGAGERQEATAVSHNVTQSVTQTFVSHNVTQPVTQPDTQTGHKLIHEADTNEDLCNIIGTLINNNNINNNYNNQDSDSRARNAVFSEYEKLIGTLTPRVVEVIDGYDLPNELKIYAINAAHDNNAKTLRYIEAVLDGFIRDGVKSVDDAKRQNAEHRRRKAEKGTPEVSSGFDFDEIERLEFERRMKNKESEKGESA